MSGQESLSWGRHFSRRYCRDTNPRPFHHESVALPLSYPRSPRGILADTAEMRKAEFLATGGARKAVLYPTPGLTEGTLDRNDSCKASSGKDHNEPTGFYFGIRAVSP